jgi:hypothetical protein
VRDEELFFDTVINIMMVLAVLLFAALFAFTIYAATVGVWVPTVVIGGFAIIALSVWGIYRLRCWLR